MSLIVTNPPVPPSPVGLYDSASIQFLPSGTGAITTDTVQAALRRLVHTDQYATAGNFNTATDALSGTFGMAKLTFAAPTLNSETIINRWRSADPLAGDFTFMLDDNGVVSGDRDNIWILGYNLAGAQVRELASEPAWGWAIENNFNNGAGANLMEMHFQGAHSDGTAFRNLSFTINRSTKSISGFIAADSWSFQDVTNANAYINITGISTSAAAVGIASGTQITKTANNQQWLSQYNAALGAAIEIARVDASNRVSIAPGGGASIIGGALTVSGASITQGIVVWSSNDLSASGDNTTLFAISGGTSGGSGNILLYGGAHATTPNEIVFRSGVSTRWKIATSTGRLVSGGNLAFAHGTSALATNATEGFFHIQSCAGAPSGTPATIPTGQIPMVWDSSNLQLYAYTGGAWKKSAVFT